MRRLHEVFNSFINQFVSGVTAHILIALYGRRRHSDLSHLEMKLKDFEQCFGVLKFQIRLSDVPRKLMDLILRAEEDFCLYPWYARVLSPSSLGRTVREGDDCLQSERETAEAHSLHGSVGQGLCQAKLVITTDK